MILLDYKMVGFRLKTLSFKAATCVEPGGEPNVECFVDSAMIYNFFFSKQHMGMSSQASYY